MLDSAELLRRAKEKGQLGRIIFGNDCPSGTGIIPLGIIRNICQIASVSDIPGEIALCMATGNSAKVFGLNNEENAVLADTLLTDAVKVGKPALEKPQMKSLDQTLIGVNVTWKKLSGAEGYEVYRATSANGSYSKIATVRDQDYWDILIANKKTYYYKVRAYQGSGKNRVYSEFSDVKSIKVQKFKLF